MGKLEQLVQSTVDGDQAAWRELQTSLEPMIDAIARRHPGLRSKGLAALQDDLAEVKVASLERLARDQFKNLSRYLERARTSCEETGSFETWVYGAVDFAIREHLRQRYGRAPKVLPDQVQEVRPSKRELQSQAARLDDVVERSFLATVGMTTRLTVAQIFAHIEQDFTPEESRAMRLYYSEDRSFADIAGELSLADDKSAERMIRRLNARLRYHFADPSESDVAGR